MSKNIFKMKIWDGIRIMLVSSVRIERVYSNLYGESEKITFDVKSNSGNRFSVSNVWIQDKNGNVFIQGLWFRTEEYNNEAYIQPSSGIARLLEYYDCSCIGDMVGKTVELYPDDNDYLVLLAYKKK